MLTTLQAMNSGVATGSPATVNYYFDPQVEFLELGRMVDNPGNSPAAARTWKVYGPDKSGVYGGAQGEGGLENEVDEQQSFASQPFTNYFGDEVGAFYSPSVGAGYAYSPYSYGVTVGGYGYEPGSPEFLSTPVETPAWRGRYADDYTGFICFGARYYEYHSGRWLSADPLGNGSSMSLYDYCNGDPVNGMDPDGRFGKGALDGMEGNIGAGDPNSAAFNLGYDIGNVLGSTTVGTDLFTQGLVNRANPVADIEGLYQSYQQNYAAYGDTYIAANATFNPAFTAEAGLTEAYTGLGIQASDSGETLSGWQRAGSTLEGVQGTVGTVGVAFGAVELGGTVYSSWSGAAAEGIAPTREGLIEISQHLSTVSAEGPEFEMYSRLTTAFENGESLTGIDANFYQHELIESNLVNGGMS